jgi:hypothetical protein
MGFRQKAGWLVGVEESDVDVSTESSFAEIKSEASQGVDQFR